MASRSIAYIGGAIFFSLHLFHHEYNPNATFSIENVARFKNRVPVMYAPYMKPLNFGPTGKMVTLKET